ncbi:hypothetical protein SBA1_880001 [Candidatus Sulfotelmatobacter kueseliae]|uniref:Uncharacterized protein n=1 Tax=Candidatus Sulfotelmatobacter kueseliae TaxID=2042962 RepID=A0A2U3L9V4_9BACT|nr:hypothetical protein SBA1_880001 [Candidatus Sulfotelmatobacter kueseliae]
MFRNRLQGGGFLYLSYHEIVKGMRRIDEQFGEGGVSGSKDE